MAPGHDPFAPVSSTVDADAPDPAALGPHGKYHLPDGVVERFTRLGATEAMMEDWRARMEEATEEERRETLAGLPPDGEEEDTLMAAAIADVIERGWGDDSDLDDEDGECRICAELPEEVRADLPEHEPGAHVGDASHGFVFDDDVPFIEHTPDTDAPVFSSGWFEAAYPDGPAIIGEHGTYEPPAEWIPLPDAIAAGMLANGATAEEALKLAERWQDGTDEDRAAAIAMSAEFTPEEWVEFVTGWRDVIESGVLSQETDDDDQTVAWLPPLNLNGTAPTPEEDTGPVPEGHVRAEVGVDFGEQGYTLAGDVPEEHQAALAYLNAAAEDDETPAADRARLVLAAEMTRPTSKRRKSILDAVTEVLGADEVTARTTEE
jgi:hypothetical protein